MIPAPPPLPNMPPRKGCMIYECLRCGGRAQVVAPAVPQLCLIATILGPAYVLNWSFTGPEGIDKWWLEEWAGNHYGPFKPISSHFH